MLSEWLTLSSPLSLWLLVYIFGWALHKMGRAPNKICWTKFLNFLFFCALSLNQFLPQHSTNNHAGLSPYFRDIKFKCFGLKIFINMRSLTAGGMIQLNHGRPQPLQYVANAAFLASLFADYLHTTGVPGWYCGPNYFSSDVLRRFATSQACPSPPISLFISWIA